MTEQGQHPRPARVAAVQQQRTARHVMWRDFSWGRRCRRPLRAGMARIVPALWGTGSIARSSDHGLSSASVPSWYRASNMIT
jgi:hypothetical protein